MFSKTLSLLLVFCFSFCACGSRQDEEFPLDSDGNPSLAAADEAGSACSITFRVYQKDAYLEASGRNMPFWPPHTTTDVIARCPSGYLRRAERPNHGTQVAALDADGNRVLKLVHQRVLNGSRQRVESLLAAFNACECGNTFLSANSIQDDAVRGLFASLSVYLSDKINCSIAIGGNGAMLHALRVGELDFVRNNAASCTWEGSDDWQAVVGRAWQEVARENADALSGYHVCNNDARLQAQLVEGFASSSVGLVCNPASSLCVGPSWFFDPASD